MSDVGGMAEAHDDRLAALTERLAEIAGDVSTPDVTRARNLARLERDLLATLPVLAAEDPEFEGIRGHPTLADASRWRDEAEALEVDPEVAQELVDQFTVDEVAAFATQVESLLPEADADLCFALLRQATVLERDALARRARGVHLGALRARLRAAFKAAVQAAPPGPARLDDWVTDLLDRADTVLTSIDDLAPDRAAQHLALVKDDLDWHLDEIDRKKRWLRIRLRRKFRRLRAEHQERTLQASLERRFGAKSVARFDRMIVALIFFVLAVLVVDTAFDLPDHVRIPLLLADTVACFVFLWEFFVKLSMVGGSRANWFARHFFVDLLPSLPFGLVVLGNLQSVRAGRALRFLRIFRVARNLRWLLPFLRLVRGFGFLTRGLDRLVRSYGHLLNRDIILFPNRRERAIARREQADVMVRARRLRAALGRVWRDLVEGTEPDDRPAVIAARVHGLQDARREGNTSPRRIDPRRRPDLGDVPADAFIHRLAAMNPQELQADMGDDFIARAARFVRVFSRIPIRWFPIIRRYVPRIAPAMDDTDVVCAASHSISAEMKRHHDRWFWFADLSGTVTPSEFVDRVGTAMVKGAMRPAYRLVVFGGVFLIVQTLLLMVGTPRPPQTDPSTPVAVEETETVAAEDDHAARTFLLRVHRFLKKYVGIPLIALGAICIVTLGAGWWMKRIAGEATFFFDQTAKAQFIALMETVKGRYLERDVRTLDERVIRPETEIHESEHPEGEAGRRRDVEAAVREWLVEAHVCVLDGGFDLLERVILLYRDGLDGGLFCESDTRTTSQLLGNPALRQLRALSERIDRKERKALRALDLDQTRLSFRGPYLWFNYVSKAIAQAAARLIVEYNRNAIPLDDLQYAAVPERKAYERWLERPSPLPAELEKEVPTERLDYVTTAFTALHFLDDDPGRDKDVEQRFGPAVLENLRNDRRLLFRTVFGTYPRHMRPRDRRVVNLYKTYESWFAGGRALLIPLRVAWRGLAAFGSFVEWLLGAIGEIRRPKPRHDPAASAEADFPTALRKIDRMRGPIVWACLWMRARFDVEYLGLELPGGAEPWPYELTVFDDLRFLGDDPVRTRQVIEERDRAEWDVRRFARLMDEGLRERLAKALGLPVERLGAEHVRAAMAAYRADISGVRAHLSCHEILREIAIEARRRPVAPRTWRPQLARRRAFRRWWAEHGEGGKDARLAAWRAIARDEQESGKALDVLATIGREAAREQGVKALADHLRHVGRISEQLVTLRTVQTLSLIDLLNYRGHVYRLGDYAASGDLPAESLSLDARGSAYASNET